MDFTKLAYANIFNLPLIAFLLGIALSFFLKNLKLPEFLNKVLTVYILFCVGLKGGAPLAEHLFSSFSLFLMLTFFLLFWGFFQPYLSFLILRKFTALDRPTALAVAASFGSVSVMTFIAAVSFLESISLSYKSFIVAVFALMEMPGIISALCLMKRYEENKTVRFSSVLFESIFNKAIMSIFFGLVCGFFLYSFSLDYTIKTALLPFSASLSIFLLDMGLRVGSQRASFAKVSWHVNIFALYMPVIGAFFGLFLSYLLQLDVGTGTLVAVLCGSASYIAVPAAMRIALPEAKEAVYLPLALGVAFPFNVVLGIPIYYYFASKILA